MHHTEFFQPVEFYNRFLFVKKNIYGNLTTCLTLNVSQDQTFLLLFLESFWWYNIVFRSCFLLQPTPRKKKNTFYVKCIAIIKILFNAKYILFIYSFI